jgi:hypothetical protein
LRPRNIPRRPISRVNGKRSLGWYVSWQISIQRSLILWIESIQILQSCYLWERPYEHTPKETIYDENKDELTLRPEKIRITIDGSSDAKDLISKEMHFRNVIGEWVLKQVDV